MPGASWTTNQQRSKVSMSAHIDGLARDRDTTWGVPRSRFLVELVAGLIAGLAFCASPGRADAATVTIDTNRTYQTIDGFGAAQPKGTPGVFAAYLHGWPEPERSQILDLAFSDLKGIGLTILRTDVDVGLEPARGQWSYDDPDQAWVMQQASARGPVKLFASVFSPPAWMKTNGSTIGGSLSPAHFKDFADYLAHFSVDYAAANGVKIYAVSMGNEPDTSDVPWDTCGWTSAQIADFLANDLRPVFAKRHVETKVIATEAANWDHVEASASEVGPPFMSDTYARPKALARTDIVAGHVYGGDLSRPFQRALAAGKKIWQTEASLRSDGPIFQNIDTALNWAKTLHSGLAGAQASAWVWFTLFKPPTNDALIESAADGHGYAPTKVFWALGNFSKFVRPGDVRIDARASGIPSTLSVSAYKHPGDDRVVIVAVNQGSSATGVDFRLGFSALATPYVTSASSDLQAQADVSLDRTVTIPARSIVTYVTTPPRLTADILWRHADGRTMVWLGAQSTMASYPGALVADWRIQGVGDFDGNGRSDILWRNADSTTAIWHDGDAGWTTWPGVLGNDWQIQGTGDFDGNGRSDILWRHVDGTTAIWHDGSAAWTTWPGSLGADWQIQGVGDFDGDGMSDILWRNADGTTAIWHDGTAAWTTWPGALGGDWQIQGVGEFDGNGMSDILWRNASGATALWHDGSAAWTTWPGALDGNWQIRSVGDFDGNGLSDILWRYADGTLAIWHDGGPAWTTWPGRPDAGWDIQGAGRFDR
jgi:glucuronoarabinoxylan endo-1,4-beta-xylanase